MKLSRKHLVAGKSTYMENLDVRSDVFMWAMIGFLVIGMGVPVFCGVYLQAKFMNKWLGKVIPKTKKKKGK